MSTLEDKYHFFLRTLHRCKFSKNEYMFRLLLDKLPPPKRVIHRNHSKPVIPAQAGIQCRASDLGGCYLVRTLKNGFIHPDTLL